MTKVQQFKRAIRAEFNWAKIKQIAHEQGEVWLGSVFSLTPSGKVYAPFACGNLDRCRRCKGTGKVFNRKADPAVYTAANARNAELLADLLANHGPWFERAWPADLEAELEASRKLARAHEPELACTWCDGCGSREAAQDGWWFDAFDEVADEHGLLAGRFDGDSDDGVWVHDMHSPALADREAM